MKKTTSKNKKKADGTDETEVVKDYKGVAVVPAKTAVVMEDVTEDDANSPKTYSQRVPAQDESSAGANCKYSYVALRIQPLAQTA